MAAAVHGLPPLVVSDPPRTYSDSHALQRPTDRVCYRCICVVDEEVRESLDSRFCRLYCVSALRRVAGCWFFRDPGNGGFTERRQLTYRLSPEGANC